MPLSRNNKNTSVNPRTASRYVKNVGRSLGYAAVESLGNNAPALKALFSDNKDTVQSLYQEIKDFASSPLDKIKSNEKLMSYSNDIKTGFSNLIDDIKTGNLYNYDRQNSAMMSMMGFDDSDIFGDIDFDSDLEDLDSNIKSETVSKEIDAMDDIGARVSSSVSMATAKSAEYIVQANVQNTRAVLNQTSRIFNAVSTGLLGVNKTLGSIAQLAQPLTTHMQNSSVFYTESTKNQEKMIELLTTIAENTKRPEPKKGNKKEYFGIDAFLGADYAFNLSNMGSMIKKNAKNAFENSTLGMLAGMNDMFGEGSLIKMVTANPIGMAMPFLLDAMMTKKLKDSMKKLSDTMGAFNIKLIKDLNKLSRSSNPILSFIGELFNYDDKNKSKRDTGEYEKGAISFDGVTKHAIVRVIPEYLGMILAQLGGPNTKYDYKTGKFTTVSQIKAKQHKEYQREVENLSFETEMDVQEAFSKSEADKIEKSLRLYISKALKEGNYIDPNTTYSEAECKKFGLNAGQMKQMQKLIKYYERTHQATKIEILNQQIREARNARAAATIEDPYLSNEDYLLDNSIGMVSGGAYPYRGRESRTKSTKKKSGSGKKSEEPDPDQLSARYITEKVLSKGYSTESRVYKRYLDRLNKATTTQEKEKIIKDLDKLANKSENSGFTNRMLGEGSEETGISKLLASPMGFLADQMNKASDALYHIMYGKDKNEIGKSGKKYDTSSIIGNVFKHMDDVFTTFKDFLKKDIMDPIKKYFEERGGLVKMITDFFGIDDPEGLKAFVKGKAKDLWTGVKGNLKSAGRWAWNNSPVVQGYRAYKGRKTAREAASDWLESLGSNYMPEGSGSGLKRFRGGATAEEMYQSGKQKIGDFFSEDKNGFGYQVGKEVFGGLRSFFSAIMPDKEKAEKETDTISKFIKSSVKEIDPAGAVTGALLGGGVSLLTGGMISPMLAASLGAAAGITIKSEKVQNMLFGEVDEESGDRQGGLFNKELSNFITKQLPGIAAWGTTGGVLAMLPGVPGGPVAGIILGSALGFAKNNQTIQNFLWGEDENDVGILGTKKDQKDKIDWIKKMLPKAAAGAVIGAVAGPFGFTGNIIAGAALGFASETEIFKRTMFGEEEPVLDENGKPMKDDDGNIVYARNGGIAGWIKKDIISPVASAIKPIASELKFKAKSIVRGMGRMIANVFKERVGTPIFARINEYLLKPFFKTIKKPAEFIGGVFTAPFRAIGAYGQHLKNKQVSQGRADYMSAKERLAYRESLDYKRLGLDKSEDKYIEFDTALAGMDEDQLASIGQRLKEAQKAQKKNLHATNQKLQAIITYIQHGYGVKPADFFNKRLQKKDMTMTATIMAYNNSKAVQSGKFEAISDTDKPILQGMYEEYIDTQDLFLGSEGATADALKELQEQLGLKGVNIKEGNIDRYLDMARAELKFRQSGTEAVKLDPEKMRNELIQVQTDKIHARIVDVANGILGIGRMLDAGLFGGKFNNYLKPLEGSTADYKKSHPNGNVVDKVATATISKEDQEFVEDFQESMAESRASGSRIGRYFAKGSRLRKMFGGAALVGAGSQFSLFGALKTKMDRDGQEVIDTQDKESRGTLKLRDKFFNEFEEIANYVKKIFGKLPTEDDKEEEKKEKKGFLDSILEGITGEGGLLGGLSSWFGGTSVGKWAGTFLSKLPSLPTIIAGAGGVALGALGLKFVSDAVKGKWNDLAHQLGWGALDPKNSDEDMGVGSNAKLTGGTGVDANGNVKAVAYDKNGQPITDENGNVLATDGSVVTNFKANTGFTFGQKMIGNTARSLVTGTGVAMTSAKTIGWGVDKLTSGFVKGGLATNLANKVSSKVTGGIGNAIAKNAAKGLGDAAKSALAFGGAGDVIADQLLDPKTGQVYKVFNALKKVPVLKNFAGALDDMAASLSETIAKKLAGKSAEEVGKAVLSFAAFAAKIALIAIDFEEGYNHAQRTLGIKEPSIPQKILSGIIRVVKNLIPIVGSLIPDKIVVDLFVKIIAPFMGIDVNKFMSERQAAEDELAEYNKANNSNLSWEDYVQSVGQQEGWGEKTWGEGIVSGVKTLGTNIKSGAKKAGSWVKGKVTGAKEAIINSPIYQKIQEVTGGIGDFLSDAFKSAKSSLGSVKNATVDLAKYIAAGDVSGVISYNPMTQVAEDNPLGKILHFIIFAEKMKSIIPAGISWVGHKAFDFGKKIFNTAKSSFTSVGKSTVDLAKLVAAGDVGGVIQYDPGTQVGEDNPIGKFLEGIVGFEKMRSVIPAGISWVGHKAFDAGKAIIDKVRAGFQTYNSLEGQLDSYVSAGDVSGLLASEYQSEEGEEGSGGGIWGAFYNIAKYAKVPLAGISWVGHKLFDGIKTMISNTKEDVAALPENIKALKDNGEGQDGLSKIVSIWTAQTTAYKSPLAGLFDTITTIAKVISTITTAIGIIAEPVKEKIEKLKETATGIKEGVVNTVGKAKETVGNAVSGVKNTVASAWDTLWNGAGSFVSQLAPGVANRRFGSSTIGENGCAPSVASMITGYGLGTTAKMATRGGYANAYGTSADYFGRVFNAAGIPSEYVYTGGNSAQDYLARRIAGGSPTVLLGRDPYNTSKAYSPFGPGNHYVLATGMTSNGGVVVQDPESSRPNMVYDRSILNSVKLGIPTGGASGLTRARRYRGSGQVKGTDAAGTSGTVTSTKQTGTGNATENQKQIWTFLRKKGLSEAGAAGLMGCWQAESGNRPDRIEGDYMKSFPGFDKVASSSDALDNYTVNILFPAYTKVKINQSAYKASDGHYYPGFGLAQWTGGRGLDLFNFCKTKHWDWKTLKAQLEFAWSELSGRYSNVLTELKKEGDVASMCKIAYNKYEGCSRADWLATRQKYAAEIYTALTGKTYTVPTDAGTDNFTYGTAVAAGETGAMTATGGDNSSGGIAGGILSLGSMFGKLFSSAFGKLGALFGLSSDDESSTETGGESTTGESYDTSSSSYDANDIVSGLPFDESTPRGEKQKALVSKMSSIAGKLAYNMKGPRDPDKGSADCSSTVNWAYKNVLGDTLGNTTLDMFNNSKNLSAVDRATGVSQSGYNSSTSGPNLANLQPGDIMLFSRKWATGRPYQVGHVSMYAGDGKALSHGSNGGPRLVNVANDKTYLVSKRYNDFLTNTTTKTEAQRQRELEQAQRSGAYVGESAAGSGLVGNYHIANDAYNTIHRRHRSSSSVFGGSSRIVNLSGYTNTRKAKYVSNLIRDMRAGGSATNDEVLIALLKAMITLLSNMSTNSDKINGAITNINSIVESMSMSGSSGNMNINEARKGIGVADTDSTLAELQTLLDTLASGA